MSDADPLTAVMLRQSTIAALREALSVDNSRETELRAEVSKWQQALSDANAEVERIKAIDEHDPLFNHPATKTAANPEGFFTPFNQGQKYIAINAAQIAVEEATGRLAFASHALQEYLDSLR